jgi:hypothetical protein
MKRMFTIRAVKLSAFAISAVSVLLIFQNCSKTELKSGSSGRGLASTDSFSSTETEIKSDTELLMEKVTYENIAAQNIYHHITGITLGLNSPIILKMAHYIKQNQSRAAIELAVESHDFINVTVRDIANSMAVKDGDSINTINDFVATFMGVVRDDRDARELLTGNFYYRVKGLSGVSDNVLEDIVKTNNHYRQLDNSTLDIAPHLILEEGQKIVAPNGQLVVLEDAAGLLTTRGFMEAHAKAGTNRRIIEYAFKKFLCSPIQSWASTQRTDYFIGRDVSRKPASEFNNKCKGCHAGMDALRPATAYFDFFLENETSGKGYIKYDYTYTLDPNVKDPTKIDVKVPAAEQNVPYKFRRSADVFPSGYVVKDNNWVNYTNTNMFGWKNEAKGSGMQDLGVLIANSQMFSDCMSQTVYEAVCNKSYSDANKSLIQKLSTSFKNSGYSLKTLVVNTSLQKECFGLGGR